MSHVTRSPPIRTPDPLQSSRRRALRRLGSLRAMGLGAIGDIGSYSFSTVQTETIEWDSPEDWDDASDESAVVHENYGDRSDDEVSLGYRTDYSDLRHFWPLDEDSGDAIDQIGDEDLDPTSPTQDATGIAGSSGYDFDGDNDDMTGDISDPFTADSYTVTFWFNTSETSDIITLGGVQESEGSGERVRIDANIDDTGVLRLWHDDGGSITAVYTSDSVFDGDIHHAAMVRRGNGGTSELEIWIDGEEKDTNTAWSDSTSSVSANYWNWGQNNDNRYWVDMLDELMWWDTGLSSDMIKELADAGSSGYLETATKSFSSSTEPDLTDLNYDLDGETLDIRVIGSPGSGSEEEVTQTLDGDSSYSLSWNDSHTDFRVRPEFDTDDPSNSPTIKGIGLTG